MYKRIGLIKYFLLSFLFLSLNCIAQNDSLISKKRITFPDYNWRNAIRLGTGFYGTYELGFEKWKLLRKPIIFTDICLPNELMDHARLINPQISVEYIFTFLGTRLILLNYNDAAIHEVRLRPEIGFTFIGLTSIYYGYDIKLNNQDYTAVPIQRWFLDFNIPILNNNTINYQNYTHSESTFSMKIKKINWHWGINIDQYTGGTVSLGLMRCNWQAGGWCLITMTLSNEFVPNQRLFNPKVSAGISLLLYAARLDVIDYTNLKTQEIRIRPEVGFSFFGIINVLYGQDIKINNEGFNGIIPFGWTLTLNIPIAKRGSLESLF